MTTARLAFDRLAPAYDALAAGEAFRLQRQQTHRLLSQWIRPGFRVLEIGCGTGADTEFLAGLGARVVACDPGRLFTFDVRTPFGVRVSRWSYEITPTGTGCRLTENWYRVGS